MDDSAKRAGSAVITVICLIIWIALRAERCNRQNSYDYSYTPSYPVYNPDLYGTGKTDYSSAIDRTQKVLDELLAQDADYGLAIADIDPIAIGANTKNPQCAELDAVVEDTPTWKIHVGDTVLTDESGETQLMSPFPLYVTNAEEGLPQTSPETIARTSMIAERLGEEGLTAPRLTKKDLLMEIMVVPKPEKGAKKIKGAPAPGKVIVRGWIFDHAQKRVVCAGFMLLPKPKAGANATRIDDKQLSKLVDQMPQALRAMPAPQAEAE